MAASTTSTAELEGKSAFMRRLLGVHLDQLGGERVTGWFEVGADHHHPWGLVHGGVFTAVIETFATTGAYLAVKDRGQLAVGVTNVTEFLRPQREGRLEVVAEPIQQGRTQQLWQRCWQSWSPAPPLRQLQVLLDAVADGRPLHLYIPP